MKRFRFRLERVFRWQQKLCDIAEDRVRLAVAAVSGIEQELATVMATSVAAENEFADFATVGATDVLALGHFRTRVAAQERSLVQQRQARLLTLDEERKKLAAERFRLRVLERIRERDLEEHEREADKAIDALALECLYAKWQPGN